MSSIQTTLWDFSKQSTGSETPTSLSIKDQNTSASESIHNKNNIIYLNNYRKNHSIKKFNPVTQTPDPIKDEDILNQIAEHLRSHGRYGFRNWLIFFTGINIGRRCGDLLALQIGDVFDGVNMIDKIVYKESKTKKTVTFFLSDELKSAIYNYITSLPFYTFNDYLFPSQKGGHLDRKAYWRILKGVREDLDLNFRLSPHSMRKTWAYSLYQKYKNTTFEGGYDIVDQLQFMFKHSDKLTTLRYLGINDDVSERLYKENVLGNDLSITVG